MQWGWNRSRKAVAGLSLVVSRRCASPAPQRVALGTNHSNAEAPLRALPSTELCLKALGFFGESTARLEFSHAAATLQLESAELETHQLEVTVPDDPVYALS